MIHFLRLFLFQEPLTRSPPALPAPRLANPHRAHAPPSPPRSLPSHKVAPPRGRGGSAVLDAARCDPRLSILFSALFLIACVLSEYEFNNSANFDGVKKRGAGFNMAVTNADHHHQDSCYDRDWRFWLNHFLRSSTSLGAQKPFLYQFQVISCRKRVSRRRGVSSPRPWEFSFIFFFAVF